MTTSEKKADDPLQSPQVVDAAKRLAEVLRENIASCYEHTKAVVHADQSSALPWSEEAFRLLTQKNAALTKTQLTHVACIDALAAYDKSVMLATLRAGARETSDLIKGVEDKTRSVERAITAVIDGIVKSRPAEEEPAPELKHQRHEDSEAKDG